jgi:hypothetical protein
MHDKKQYDRDFYCANIQQRRAGAREYHLTHREAIRAKRRQARATDPAVRQGALEAGARWCKAHREQIRAKDRARVRERSAEQLAKDALRARERRAREGDRIRAQQRDRYAAKSLSGLLRVPSPLGRPHDDHFFDEDSVQSRVCKIRSNYALRPCADQTTQRLCERGFRFDEF